MVNLAATYWDRDRWEEAENLEVQVMNTYQMNTYINTYINYLKYTDLSCFEILRFSLGTALQLRE